LDNYKTGHLHLPPHEDTLDGTASVASFGDTHGSELARINSTDMTHAPIPHLPMTPPPQSEVAPGTFLPPDGPPPTHPEAAAARAASEGTASHPVSMPVAIPSVTSPSHAGATSPVLDPLKLNQAPAPLPTSPGGSTTAQTAADATSHPEESPLAGMTPTVAETGVPVSAGDKGPGPASGSLAELRRERFGETGQTVGSPPAAAYGVHHETAEEEKKRLQREERERVLAGQTSQAAPAAPIYESADDEKKRLEREERERLLAAGGSQQLGGNNGPDSRRQDSSKGDELPPYQEPI
jgi:hypothetical protein